MSTGTITELPKVYLSGTKVNATTGVESSVTDLQAINSVSSTGTNEYTKQDTLIFKDSVTVTLTTTLEQKNYADYSDTDNNRVGELTNPSNVNKAEIRYTINGKDPSRTKFYRYGDAFTLRRGTNHDSDSITLKARIYRQGVWSNAITVKLRVI
jgi:hypothetical protein